MVKYTDEMMKRDLNKFKNRVKKKFKLDKIILFGSRARGDFFLDSDVDLIIVSEDFKDKFFTSRMSDILEFWDAPVDLEPLCYTPEEFKKKKKQIGTVRQALKEGIEI